MRSNRRSTYLLAVAATLMACSDNGTGPGSTGGDDSGEGYALTYGQSTTRLPPALVTTAMISQDDGTHTYEFDADALAEAGVELREGGILLIPGVALRRISTVTTADGVSTVTTSYASLNEAIHTGTLEWDHPIRYTAETLQSARIRAGDVWLAPSVVSATTVEWEYTVGPNMVQARLEAAGTTAQLEIEVTRMVGGAAAARFTGITTFEEMRSQAFIDIEDHETRSFSYDNAGMGGTIELRIAAAGAGLDEFAFDWPEAMIRIPITIGPVPALLILKAQIVTQLVVNGEASAQASTSFTYGGDAGFHYNGFEVSTTASAGLGMPVVGASAGDAAAFIGNTVDAQFGVAAPKIEVALFGETIVPFIRPEFFVGSRLTWGPVCKSAYVRYQVQGGIDLRFFGNTLASREAVIAGPHELRESQNDCAEGVAAGAVAGDTPGHDRWPELAF